MPVHVVVGLPCNLLPHSIMWFININCFLWVPYSGTSYSVPYMCHMTFVLRIMKALLEWRCLKIVLTVSVNIVFYIYISRPLAIVLVFNSYECSWPMPGSFDMH